MSQFPVTRVPVEQPKTPDDLGRRLGSLVAVRRNANPWTQFQLMRQENNIVQEVYTDLANAVVTQAKAEIAVHLEERLEEIDNQASERKERYLEGSAIRKHEFTKAKKTLLGKVGVEIGEAIEEIGELPMPDEFKALIQEDLRESFFDVARPITKTSR